MIFDDHDVHDDWNISDAWVQEMRAQAVVGGARSSARSWRTGSTSTSATSRPAGAGRRRVWPPSCRPTTDGGPRLREFAHMADRESAASRWAYHRDFGRSRLVVVDSRAARVLADGRRDMVDDEEWDWIVEHARGAYRPPHHREHAAGLHAAGHPLPRGVERGGLRRRLGRRSPARVGRAHAARARPRALAGVSALVRHHGRAARASSPRRGGGEPRRRSPSSAATCTRPTSPRSRSARDQRSRVYQVVCSPFRNPLPPRERRVVRWCATRGRGRVMRRARARCGRAPAPAATGAFVRGPTFDNSIAVLELDERAARVTICRSGAEEEDGPALTQLHTRVLSAG